MITARAPTSVQATILRRSPSPLQTDQSPSVSITTLPSIHKMLHPQSRSDILQRPRGSTLPSYATQGSSGHPLPNSVEFGNRIHRKERSSTISGRLHQEGLPESQHNITYAPPHPTTTASSPPAVGISLPPIRLGNDLPTSPTFNGLPPIKAMLPSPSHMLSLETRSPVSPPSPHSIVQSSSSWSSSQANNSASSGDMTGRFYHRPPPYDPHHRRRASPNSSYSPPPPSQYDDEPALFNSARSREMFDDPDGSSGYTIQRHIQPKPSDSSLLTLTSPRRSSTSSTITRLGLERGYGSDNYLGQSRSREAIPEDVAITSTPSSSIIFPSSAPNAGRHITSHRSVNISERTVNFDPSSQPGRHLSNEPIITGTFDMSEGEGRFRPGETSGGKKRRSRATQEQLDILNSVYQRTPFPTTVERTELAQQLGMTPRSVQIWFQNKRQGAKNNETRRRELPPLISNVSGSPQMPNLVPLTLAPPAMSQSPPSPATLDARSFSYTPEARRDSFENGGNLRGRARRRRMSVNDLLSHDTRDEVRSGATVSRHISRQRVDDKDL